MFVRVYQDDLFHFCGFFFKFRAASENGKFHRSCCWGKEEPKTAELQRVLSRLLKKKSYFPWKGGGGRLFNDRLGHSNTASGPV